MYCIRLQGDAWREETQELVNKTNGDGKAAVKAIRGSNKKESKCFSIDGKHLSQPQKGLNILKMSDGTSRKIVR